MGRKSTVPKMSFSDTAVSKLPFSQEYNKQVLYRDKDLPGLYLVISGSKKVFRLNVRVRSSGKAQNLRIGEFPHLNCTQAKMAATRLLADIQQGKDPSAEKKAKELEQKAKQITLRDARDEYVKVRVSAGQMRPTTAEDKYRYDFDLYGKGLLDTPLDKITPEAIEITINALRQEAEAKGKSRDTSLGIFLRSLSAVLSFANEKYSTEEKPLYARIPTKKVQKLGLLKKSKPKTRALTTKELPIFYRYLFERSSFSGYGQTSADFFIFALLTGARAGEIEELEWKDVDLIEKTVIFRDTKTHQDRLIPIGPKLADLLGRRKKSLPGEKFVFPGSGKSGHFEEPKNLTIRFLKSCPEFAHFSIHDIRRTFSSHARNEVTDPLLVSTLLGHTTKTNTTEKHYTIIGAEISTVLRDSMEAIEAALLSKCGHEEIKKGDDVPPEVKVKP